MVSGRKKIWRGAERRQREREVVERRVENWGRQTREYHETTEVICLEFKEKHN